MKNKFRNKFNIEGRNALITGGLGILGKNFCECLADHGVNIAIIDLEKNKAEEFAKIISETYNVKALGLGVDISNPDLVDKMVDRVEIEIGPIDILLNNAASKSSNLKNFFKKTEEYSLDTWNEVMSVNLTSYFLVARNVGKLMALRKKGSIIQIASIYGATMAPDQRIYDGAKYLDLEINSPAVYSASKGGVLGLSNYLATYWAKDGVRVNTLTPGGVLSGQNEVFIENYSKRVPMERMAEAHEIVSALIFLASDASSYITGQNIHIDGGLSVW